MKPKLKLNASALKELALQHGEKAGFALGVLLLVMFIWSAAKTEVLGPEKQPDKLEDAATKTDNHITGAKWDPVAKGIEVVDYVQRAKRDPLNEKDYRLKNYLTNPVFNTKGKRPDPKIFAVEELQATAGLGVFAFARPTVEGEQPRGPGNKNRPPMGGPMGPPGGPIPGRKDKPKGPGGSKDAPGPLDRLAGGGKPPGGPSTGPGRPKRNSAESGMPKGVRFSRDAELRGLSWVVITGVVPIAKQEVEFEDKFGNVIKPMGDADSPQYSGYKIERTEIKPGAAPDWHEINLKANLEKFRSRWAAEAPEVADAAYLHRGYTEGLAPLVGADWDPAAVGHPKIPLMQKNGSRPPRSATGRRYERR